MAFYCLQPCVYDGQNAYHILNEFWKRILVLWWYHTDNSERRALQVGNWTQVIKCNPLEMNLSPCFTIDIIIQQED